MRTLNVQIVLHAFIKNALCCTATMWIIILSILSFHFDKGSIPFKYSLTEWHLAAALVQTSGILHKLLIATFFYLAKKIQGTICNCFTFIDASPRIVQFRATKYKLLNSIQVVLVTKIPHSYVTQNKFNYIYQVKQ